MFFEGGGGNTFIPHLSKNSLFHPSIVSWFSTVRSWKQHFQKWPPDHLNQLQLGDPEAFSGQCGDIISPPGPGPPPSWTYLEASSPNGQTTHYLFIYIFTDIPFDVSKFCQKHAIFSHYSAIYGWQCSSDVRSVSFAPAFVVSRGRIHFLFFC